MIDLLVYFSMSILAGFLLVVGMIGFGGLAFLAGSLFHYFKDLLQRRDAS